VKRLSARMADLEARQPVEVGRWHRIIQYGGQTPDEAIDAYGREKFGPNDRPIIRTIVSLKQEAPRLSTRRS